jgi:hypothetical protein
MIRTKFIQASTSVWNFSRTSLIRINWNGEASGYAENPDKWNFLSKWAT